MDWWFTCKRQNFTTARTNVGEYLYDIKINKAECKSNESLNSNVNIRQNKGQSIKDKKQKYVVEKGKAWTYAPKNIGSKNVEQQLRERMGKIDTTALATGIEDFNMSLSDQIN